jgi:hypothetical protein
MEVATNAAPEDASNGAQQVFTGGEITLYLAMDERLAMTVANTNHIDPKLFGTHVPLALTGDQALHAALGVRKKVASMQAVLYTSRWYIIEIRMTSPQIAEYMLEKSLTHCTVGGQPALQCNRCIDTTLTHCTSVVRDIPPTGLEAWSDRFLPKKNFVGLRAQCTECQDTSMRSPYIS